MKGKKVLLISIITIIAILILSGISYLIFKVLGPNPKEVIYLTEKEEVDLFKNPNKYNYKYLESSALVYKVDGNKAYAYTDFSNLDKIVILITKKDSKIKKNDYVIFDGFVSGKEEKTNYPIINGKVKTVSYMDAVNAVKETHIINKELTQKDISIKINKVKYSNSKLEVYYEITNKSKKTINLLNQSFSIVQSVNEYNISGKENKKLKIKSKSKKEGTLKFKDVSKDNFKLIIKVSDDNIFNFDINIK